MSTDGTAEPEALLAAATTQGPLGPHPVRRESAMVRMSDGTPLATDLYRPADRTAAPAVLMRTPYGLTADAPLPVEIDLGPVAHEFGVGHAVRVQVSSGAHPVYARNPGTGEPLASAERLLPADQRVHLGGDHASRVVIDTLGGPLTH